MLPNLYSPPLNGFMQSYTHISPGHRYILLTTPFLFHYIHSLTTKFHLFERGQLVNKAIHHVPDHGSLPNQIVQLHSNPAFILESLEGRLTIGRRSSFQDVGSRSRSRRIRQFVTHSRFRCTWSNRTRTGFVRCLPLCPSLRLLHCL